MTNNPGVYEGRVKFHHVHIRLISSNELLLGCSSFLEWLRKNWFIYMNNITDDNLCIRRCLIISERIRPGQPRLAERTMRDAFNLACEFYRNPNLHIRDVRLTKLIDFENIAIWFQVNIRLYKPVASLIWKLVFGQVQHKRSLPNFDVSLFKGHCLHIINLNGLVNHGNVRAANKDLSVMTITTGM